MPDFHAERDVFGDRHVLEQRVALKYEAHVAVLRRKRSDVLAVDEYAAGVLSEMEGRLAGAIGAVRKGREALTRTTAAEAAASAPLADAAAESKRVAFDSQTAGEETAALESVKA